MEESDFKKGMTIRATLNFKTIQVSFRGSVPLDNDTGFIGVTAKGTQGSIAKAAGYQDHHHKYGVEIFHGAKIVSSPEQTNLFLQTFYEDLIWINSIQELSILMKSPSELELSIKKEAVPKG